MTNPTYKSGGIGSPPCGPGWGNNIEATSGVESLWLASPSTKLNIPTTFVSCNFSFTIMGHWVHSLRPK